MTQEISSLPTCEAIILTALPVESKAVLRYLQEPQEIIHPSGTIYSWGTFPGKQRILHVARWQRSVWAVSRQHWRWKRH